MAVEHFDSIDDSHVFYNEQAYKFLETETNVFELKLAVLNPYQLLPYPKEIDTVEGILKNIDAVVAVGAKKTQYRTDKKNEFLTNFYIGMRHLYCEKYVEHKRRRDWISFSATADFSNKTNDLCACVSHYQFNAKPHLHVSANDRLSYGAVYPLNLETGEYEDLSENEGAAQRFEKSSRSHPSMEAKYRYLLTVDPMDSLGKYAVWSSGLLIRKALAKHYEDKHLHLMILDNDDTLYKSAKKEGREKGKLIAPRITAPLSNPVDLVNILQIFEYEKEQKSGLFGPKKIEKLCVELQHRYDQGIVQYAEQQRLEKLSHMQQELELVMQAQYQASHPEVLAMMEENMVEESEFETEEIKIIPHPALKRKAQTPHQMKVLKKIYKL
jgi:hypothetical protein